MEREEDLLGGLLDEDAEDEVGSLLPCGLERFGEGVKRGGAKSAPPSLAPLPVCCHCCVSHLFSSYLAVNQLPHWFCSLTPSKSHLLATMILV